jgi:hypothetical protein
MHPTRRVTKALLTSGMLNIIMVVDKSSWVLKKCANRNVLGSYYVPAEFLFW